MTPIPCPKCQTMLHTARDSRGIVVLVDGSESWHSEARCRDVLLTQRDEARAKVEEARKALEEALPLLRHDERGFHYCRGEGCDAGTHNAWVHAEHCSSARIDAAVDGARTVVRAALEKLRGK